MKQRTNIYLEERQAAALDQVARTRGLSRAEVVRALIDAGLGVGGSSDVEADIAAIEQSFGVLVDGDTFRRAPDARARHLARLARG